MVLTGDYDCPACEDTGLVSGGEICACVDALAAVGPDEDLPEWPSAEAEDRAALRLA